MGWVEQRAVRGERAGVGGWDWEGFVGLCVYPSNFVSAVECEYSV